MQKDATYSKERIAELVATQLKARALTEELERRVALTCIAIFLVLNFALFFFINDFIYKGVNLKYIALLGDVLIFLFIIFKRNPFELTRVFFAFCAGFYSYLFFCQNMQDAFIINAFYWLSATPLTIRMKAKITFFSLIISECFYIALIRILIESL